ncbi:pyridoxal kinase PdxY [Deinococcus radiophilus]|uniref:Pyridoxal kinase PdxY n=1 Tax=Deinococcus radiophilus TaxID=32062 RepID=A0A3S0ILZ7_9DEIO|nr:pyridoxal kinase PdxY [Deinococcus radiophilus]RTR27091.1 pyridoxal kinase PdxY [Deinococcus radiophilus]UFA50126.1 pyridoxal kinase PdxY [Deinococcus radiophilus]
MTISTPASEGTHLTLQQREQLPHNILSIQSWVAYGHVGNAAAMFPLQRLGFEVWAIQTVQFSNHTGYGAWTGQVFPPEDIAALIHGIEARGALPNCDGVLSGYMGSVGTVEAVISAVERVRAANPEALYCCDPVMGDFGRGVFVNPELPPVIAERAIPAADIVVPNHFELELLTDCKISTLNDALEAATALRERLRPGGPRIVVVTSLTREDAPEGTIETLVMADEGTWVCRTPLLPLDPPRNGTGDAITALFYGQYLRTGQADQALSLSMSALYALLERTHQAGTREIQLVAAQDELARPSRVFEAQAVMLQG